MLSQNYTHAESGSPSLEPDESYSSVYSDPLPQPLLPSNSMNSSIMFSSLFNDSTDPQIIEAFKSVLQNKAGIFSCFPDDDTCIYIIDNYSDDYNPVHYPFDFEIAVIDMNEDGIPEVVLNRKDATVRLVLQYNKGKVFGREYGYKALGLIKTDGSFSWGYATHFGWGTLLLTSEPWEIKQLCSYEHIVLDAPDQNMIDDIEVSPLFDFDQYMIDGIEVSPDEFTAYFEDQAGKTSAQWYELADIDFEESQNEE